MKTSLLFLLLLGASILTGIVSCKKYQPPKPDNPYGLPDATQTGAGTFACLVNGNPWIPNYYYDLSTGAIYNNDYERQYGLGARGSMEIKDNLEEMTVYIGLRLNDIKIDTPYDLSSKAEGSATMFGWGDSCFAGTEVGYGSGNIFQADASQGELTVTKLDTVKKIFSGVFWFDIPTDYCDTLKVTDGRFDFVYWVN